MDLRQSTASQEVPLGYFVDSTDGNTEETGLTIANTDIKIWKTGATTLASKNSGGATHIANGVYYAVLDATDTDTIGPLVIFVHVSGALAVRVECTVLDEAVYDAKYGTVALATATNITAATGIDVTKFGGSAGTFASGRPEVNATHFAGTAYATALAAEVDAVWDEATSGHTTAGTFGKLLADVLADTNELQTDWTNGGRLDLLVDGIIATLGAAGAGLTGIPWNAAWDAEVQSEVNDGLVAFFTSAAALVDLVWDEATSGHSTAGTTGKALSDINTITSAIGATAAANLARTCGAAGVVFGTAITGTLSTTQFTTDLTEATDDHYIGRTVVFLTGVLAGQASDITDYVGATKLVQVTAMTEAPSNNDTFIIV